MTSYLPPSIAPTAIPTTVPTTFPTALPTIVNNNNNVTSEPTAMPTIEPTEEIAEEYYSCADYMSNGDIYELANGTFTIHHIEDNITSTLDVYCIFDYTNDYAWTLIESGSRCSMENELSNSDFFDDDVAYNEENVEENRFSLYRLSLSWMDSIYAKSDLLYATCNFDISFSQDWWLLNLTETEYDPFEIESFSGVCTSVISANIRGYTCENNTVQVWQDDVGPFHYHIDSSQGACGCSEWVSDATYVGNGGEDDVCIAFCFFFVFWFVCSLQCKN